MLLQKNGLRNSKLSKNKEHKMLKTFDEIIEITLEHEGGYVHDPKDLGGETNFGIAGRFYPDVDIKNLTKDDAKEIYKKDYWDKNKVNEVPDDLKHIYFDMCVNQGRGTAVKILQRAINAKGGDLDVDGGFGPGTRAALAKHTPEQERFIYGWYKRALSV